MMLEINGPILFGDEDEASEMRKHLAQMRILLMGAKGKALKHLRLQLLELEEKQLAKES